jgi:outer membrane protein assembly factor BamB
LDFIVILYIYVFIDISCFSQGVSLYAGSGNSTAFLLTNLQLSSINFVGAAAIAADGTLYFPAYNYLLAINPSTGSVKWKQSVYFSSTSTTPAIGYDGSIYTTSSDGYLWCLYPTGSIKWSLYNGNTLYSSPTIDSSGMIYFAGNNDYNLYAVYPTGSIAWSYYMYSSVKSSPAIDSYGNLYAGTEGGLMYSIYSDGLLRWSTNSGSGQFDQSSPSIASDGTIYIGSISSDYSMYAFSKSGTIKWSYVTQGPIYAAAAVAKNGNVIFNTYDNSIISLNSNGVFQWQYSLYSSSGYSSPIIGSDGTIYTSAYCLYALHPTGSLKWVTSCNSAGPPVIASSSIIYFASYYSVFGVGISDIVSSPTIAPQPTPYPTRNPTIFPSHRPSHKPTISPSKKPTHKPTYSPSSPTFIPTFQSTFEPSIEPTINPTISPTMSPTFNSMAPTRSFYSYSIK